MSEHNQSVSAYYDEQTEPFYLELWDPDEVHFGYFFPGEDEEVLATAVRRMTNIIVDPAQIAPGERVVDVGCGVGGPAVRIAQETGCHMVGVTISARQVELGQQRAEQAGLQARVRFVLGDAARHLPFDDESIDVVMGIESACHYDDRRQFLRECARILKPGGRLVVSDWMVRDYGDPVARAHHIQQFCSEWLMPPLESLGDYERMLSEIDVFEQLSFVDMYDATIYNARLLDLSYRSMLLREMSDLELSPHHSKWKLHFKTLADAWLGGYFTIGRFVAHKVTD